ncbi:MAG: lysophospholipid acyltransferase family protein [Deltaproteobacteria bacterium]|nr:lysophospholipid acyltransferase family protein [Deltaproteobacteria bacterium]MBT6433866.1 lysophospholipid acyltransferase family protein [Deltaproteobacteria bacterium]MBT6489275.1 lysophospholipid acyltransferase family protein [Deltaproteobacteria bacterium]
MSTKLLCYIFYGLARLFKLTYRFRYAGVSNLEAAKAHRDEGSYCLASWHEHALSGVLGQAGMKYCFLISQSKDGEFVDFICRRLGYETVRGSSSKGGKEARLALEDSINRGVATAFTVDGPRGPRKQCKPGVLKTAMETKTAILPVAAVADRYWVISKSWDKTKIPKPFAKIVYQFGSLIEVPSNLEGEAFDTMIETINRHLNDTESEATANLAHWSKSTKRLPKSVFS